MSLNKLRFFPFFQLFLMHMHWNKIEKKRIIGHIDNIDNSNKQKMSLVR
jgi:hypothetical protein